MASERRPGTDILLIAAHSPWGGAIVYAPPLSTMLQADDMTTAQRERAIKRVQALYESLLARTVTICDKSFLMSEPDFHRTLLLWNEALEDVSREINGIEDERSCTDREPLSYPQDTACYES